MPKIHPTAIVEPGATLADDVEIGPYCLVGGEVTVGARTRLLSHVVLEGWTEIGEDNEIHPFARIGAPPQHNAHKGERTRLTVGDRNIMREQVTMHCGTAIGTGHTKVGSDCLFYVGAHVAHDCEVEDHVVMINNSTLGGHTHVGEWATLGGFAACHQWTRIGRHAMIGGLAAVTKDVIPFGLAWGNHVHLEGLNLVGLRRRGFTREAVNTMRAAYGVLFAHGGTFQERVSETAESFSGSPEVMEIIDFIRADANRPLCLPERDV